MDKDVYYGITPDNYLLMTDEETHKTPHKGHVRQVMGLSTEYPVLILNDEHGTPVLAPFYYIREPSTFRDALVSGASIIANEHHDAHAVNIMESVLPDIEAKPLKKLGKPLTDTKISTLGQEHKHKPKQKTRTSRDSSGAKSKSKSMMRGDKKPSLPPISLYQDPDYDPWTDPDYDPVLDPYFDPERDPDVYGDYLGYNEYYIFNPTSGYWEYETYSDDELDD